MSGFDYREYLELEKHINQAEEQTIRENFQSVVRGNDFEDKSSAEMEQFFWLFRHGWICKSLSLAPIGDAISPEDYLRSVIRQLREKMWWKVGYHRSHERQWESEEDEERRESQNRREKQEWDIETERLCSGKTCDLRDRC
jgi:hypothetical protein